MEETLLKPMGEATPAEMTAENKADLIRLFELQSDQLSDLFSELTKNKDTFTAAKLSSLLGVQTPIAANIYETFLDIIHMNSTHGTTLESIGADLRSVGCEEGKVESFLAALKGLDDDTKRAADVLVTATSAVSNYPHIGQLGYDLTYLQVPQFGGRDMKSILPVVILQITLSEDGPKGEQERTIQIHLPITEIERLAKSIESISKDAREQARRFKKEIGGKFFIPEG